MKKLTHRETLRHIALLITAAPSHIEKSAEAASFIALVERLRGLVEASNTAELSTRALRSTLFPHASGDSQRVLLASFRKTITTIATAAGRNFVLHQPNLRGKDLDEVICYFEGDSFPDEREQLTTTATEKLDELTQSETRLIPDVIRIFISFANADREKVEKFKTCLESTWGNRRTHKIEFWTFYNLKDGGILAGENNLERIQEAIASCPIALFLLTPDFSKSNFIKEHELPAYTSKKSGRYPIFINLRNSKPPAPHLADALLTQNIFSLQEKSFDEMRGQTAQEKFAEAVNDHIELYCQKHFSIDAPSPAKIKVPSRTVTTERDSLVPDTREEDCSLIDPNYQRNEKGVNAVEDLLAWAKDENRGHYLALLGETGAGKTTTLLMFARLLNSEKGAIRAYLFDLRFVNYDGLLERTNHRPSLLEIMSAILQRGGSGDLRADDYLTAVREERAILIFDGLDEIFVALDSSQQDSFMKEIFSALPLATARKDESGKLLLACRTQYYRSPQAESGSLALQGREGLEIEQGPIKRTHIEIARVLPFTESQIRSYFEANLPAIPFEQIWKILEEIHNLKELASRPYLLNLIRRQLPMLNEKVERNEAVSTIDLYRGFVENWSHERNKFHNIILAEDKNDLMEALAVHMWCLQTKSLLAADLERWLLDTLVTHARWRVIYADQLKPKAQESLLSDFRTASFMSRWDGDSFRFAHTSLQEYFLGCHLARSLYARDGQPENSWDLPMPSLETMDFLGQIIQTLPARDQETAILRLRQLLGNPAAPLLARTVALRYWLLAMEKSLPAPNCPDLAMTGADLTGWEFHGTQQQPLRFGPVDFSKATLLRTSFEWMDVAPASQWQQADLRSAKFIECQLSEADFTSTRLDGIFFRKCDLRDSVTDRVVTSSALLHLCQTTPNGQWPQISQPTQLSIAFLNGHAWSVTSVAFSPDGNFIVSGSDDKSLKLWDTRSGHCIRSFIGHEVEVICGAFSPDGTLIISASLDYSLKLWDTDSGECIRAFLGHKDWVTSAAFSPNRDYIISGSFDDSLKLWDIRTGACLRSFLGHADGIWSVSFSPDGHSIVSGSLDNSLKLWDIRSGQCISSFLGHDEMISSVSFAPNGHFIVSGSYDKSLKLWDIRSGECIRSFLGHENGVTSISFSPDGHFIVSGSLDKSLKLWDIRSGECLRSFLGHNGRINSVAFSPCGTLLISGAEDNGLMLWDKRSGECIRCFSASNYRVFSACFSPDGQQIVAQDYDGKVLAFSLSGAHLPVPVAAHEWIANNSLVSTSGLSLQLNGDSTILLSQNDILIREILPLANGESIVREPWDEIEALKPAYACRWKFVSGPADAWRYCAAIDPETLTIHPPELAMADPS
jgi:WD40 repeat protein/energy-coupling factor transporter ATP-binding protein EcfA2